jgi:hypothetical protein
MLFTRPGIRPVCAAPPYSIDHLDISVIALFRDRCIGYPEFRRSGRRLEAPGLA